MVRRTDRGAGAAGGSGPDEALAKRAIPYRRGEVLVAVDGKHQAAVAEVIGELGMDYQQIRNRAALMVLPAGITKGTGLTAFLEKVNLSPHNTVAVGDAENDLSLLAVAEVGAAVSDAVRSLRRSADVVLDEPGGAGVVGLLAGPYLSGAERLCPPRTGWRSERSRTEAQPGCRAARHASWSAGRPRPERATSSV